MSKLVANNGLTLAGATVKSETAGRVEFANTLRGVAIILVMIVHFTGVFWMGRDMNVFITNSTKLSDSVATPVSFIYLNTIPYINWGSLGVAIFFLVSGFVMPFSLNKSKAISFVANRFIRIVPVYAAGFTISLLLIAFSSWHYNQEWVLKTSDILIHYVPGIRDVLGGRQIDGVIWTLEIEMKFYIVCAIFIRIFKNRDASIFIIPAILFCIAYMCRAIYANQSIDYEVRGMIVSFSYSLQYIIFMFIGVSFNYLYNKQISFSFFCMSVLCIFSLFLICFYENDKSAYMLSVTYFISILIFSIFWLFSSLSKIKFLRFMAKISYSLYVCHMVVGFLTMRILSDFGVNPVISTACAFSLSILVASILYKIAERPCHLLAKKFS